MQEAHSATTLPTSQPVAPTITLHLQDSPPDQALQAFSHVANLTFADPAPGFWAQGDTPPAISLDLKDQSFWDALSQVQKKLNIGFVADNNGDNITPTHDQPDWGWTGRPETAVGPVLLSVRKINHQTTIPYADPSQAFDRITLSLRAFVQPGTDWAIDQNGFEMTSLLTDQGLELHPRQTPQHPTGQAISGTATRALTAFAPAGSKISWVTLAGNVYCVGSSNHETIEIDNAETAALDREVVGFKVHLSTSRNARNIEVHLTCPVPPATDPKSVWTFRQRLSSIWSGRVKMFDANGIELISHPDFARPPFPRRGMSRGLPDQLDLILDFSPPDALPPYKLIWTVPTALDEITLPFKIGQIAIP